MSRHVTCWLCPAQRPAWTTRGTWWGQVPRRRRDRDTPSRLRYSMERNTVEWVCWRSACSSLTLFAQDYDDFDVANEDDELEEFLGIPRKTPKVWIELKKKNFSKAQTRNSFSQIKVKIHFKEGSHSNQLLIDERKMTSLLCLDLVSV